MKLIIAGIAAVGLIFLIIGLNSKNDNDNKEFESKVNNEEYLNLCPHAEEMSQEQCNRIYRPCESDADCNKDQQSTEKCCWNGCHTKSCRQPVKVSKTLKTGGCPISTYDPQIMCDFIYPEYQDCRHDSECPDKKKCCAEGPCAFRKCKDPVEERKGNCPNFSYDIRECKPFSESDFECRTDSDCRNPNHKCCRDQCFLLKCQNSV